MYKLNSYKINFLIKKSEIFINKIYRLVAIESLMKIRYKQDT